MIEHPDTLTKVGATTSVGVVGTSYTYLGLPMGDWVGIGTLVYLMAQTIRTLTPLVADLCRWLKRRRNHEQSD